MDKSYEFVEHPSHYNKPGEKETIEKMVDLWGKKNVAMWCRITAFKYQDRAGDKPGESEERDLKKRQWYLDKAEELERSLYVD